MVWQRKTGWEDSFLETLKNTANIRLSCEVAGVTRKVVDCRRKSDPEFEEHFNEARDDAIDTLEAAALSRARDGVERIKTVYYQGKPIGTETIREYSDLLMIFLLKANRPDKYRDQISVTHQTQVLKQEAERIAREQGLDPEAVMQEAERIMQGK